MEHEHGPYSNTDTESIYRQSQSGAQTLSRAERWVEAENIFACREFFIKWFEWMEDGVAESKYPDPSDDSVSPFRADKLVAEIDADMEKELTRARNHGYTAGPGYSRLSHHARLAMAQEFFHLVKQIDQIKKEAYERVAAGEKIPPFDEETLSPYDGSDPYAEMWDGAYTSGYYGV